MWVWPAICWAWKMSAMSAWEMPELRWGSRLLYGGSDVQVRPDVRIYPLTKIHDLLAAIA
jgi:hypothetical protein